MDSVKNPKEQGAVPAETPKTPEAVTPADVPKETPALKLHVNPDAVTAPASDERKLELVLDIPLRVSVELGRTKILVQDLLQLHKGSVLELVKTAGEPLEILVNDKVVARGEVIVVNDKFGVRLTEVVDHNQRIRQLGEG